VPWDSYNWGHDNEAMDAMDAAEARRAARRARSLECSDGTCGGCARCGWTDEPTNQADNSDLFLPRCDHQQTATVIAGRSATRVCADCGHIVSSVVLRRFATGALRPFRPTAGEPVSAADAARIFNDC
jgi:hypothetical protein